MQLGMLYSSAFNQNIFQLANLHSNSNRTLFISLLFYDTFISATINAHISMLRYPIQLSHYRLQRQPRYHSEATSTPSGQTKVLISPTVTAAAYYAMDRLNK